MEKELREIFDKNNFGFGEIDVDNAVKDILRLFNVCKQNTTMQSISQEEIEKLAYEQFDSSDYNNQLEFDDAIYDWIKGFKYALNLNKCAELNAGKEWISVEDRLPKYESFGQSEFVLTYNGNSFNINLYDYELNRWATAVKKDKITHWMPLPNKPSNH